MLSKFSFEERKSKDVRVGDVIRVEKNEVFPCDILLLQHDPQMEYVYVETMSLDGETSLKRKVRHADRRINLQGVAPPQLHEQRLELHYEKPNPNLYSFNGYLQLREEDTKGAKLFFDNNNLLLRGCSLRINQFAVGLVVYSGHDTKVMLNSTNAVPKRSDLEGRMNSYFRVTFVSQFVLTFIWYCCVDLAPWCTPSSTRPTRTPTPTSRASRTSWSTCSSPGAPGSSSSPASCPSVSWSRWS